MSVWRTDFDCVYMCVFNKNTLLHVPIKALESKPFLL